MLSIIDVRKITDIEDNNIPVFKAIHTTKKRIQIMQHTDDASGIMTEEVWQEVVYQRPAAPETPLRSESRVARFFNALAASMALQQRRPWSPCRNNRIVFPSEILAQNYPHLYIQVMCG